MKTSILTKVGTSILLLVLIISTATECNSQPTGSSLLLNGINNYINVNDNPSLDFADTLSLEFWINPYDPVQGTVISKGICQNANYGYYVSVDSGKVSFQWSPNGSCQGGNANYIQTDSVVLFPFQCTHVAIVFDTSNSVIYIDGIAVNTTSNTPNNTPIHNSSEPLRIGVYRKVNPIALVAYYPGELDELRFWNYRLTSAEINSRMNTSLTGNEPGLVAYYDMEETGMGNGFTVINKAIATGSALNGNSIGTAVAPSHVPVCSIVGLNEQQVNLQFPTIYPNPAKEIITLDLSLIEDEISTLVIYNSLGKEVLRVDTNVGSKVNVPIRNLPSGVFLIQLYGKHKNYQNRFIKN